MTEKDIFCQRGLAILDKADEIYEKIERCGIEAEYDRLKGELDRLLDGEFRQLREEAAAKGICLREGTILAWERAQRSGK